MVAAWRSPLLISDVLARMALRLDRQVPAARYRLDPASDTVQILCKAANVSGSTVRAGFDAGQIGLMWSRDGTQVSTTATTWLAAVTDTAIAAHSDGEVVGTLANSAALYRGFYFQVTLDLENGEQPQTFKDYLHLDY
jgi:hypothetical protein